MDNKGHSDESSDGNEEHVWHWGESVSCYKVEKNLAVLCSWPGVSWKVEIIRNEIGCLAEEIFKQSVEERPGFSWKCIMKYEIRTMTWRWNGESKRKESYNIWTIFLKGFLGASDDEDSSCNVRNLGLIHGLGRSPEKGNKCSLQYFCLEISMERGAWLITFYGVAKSQIGLSN